jgi:hypothetical protein
VPPARHSRVVLPFLVVVLGLLLLAPQASAADTFRFTGRTAFARWLLNDPLNTKVGIVPFDGKFHSPPGRPVPNRTLEIFVSQEFCDQANDRHVFRIFEDFFGATLQSLSIDHALRRAAVAGSTTFTGVEQRFAGTCANPDFDNYTISDLGTFPIQFSAQWTGIGPVSQSANDIRQKLGPQCKFSEKSRFSVRNATATGSITGALPLGNLGTTNDATIESIREMVLIIERGCFD